MNPFLAALEILPESASTAAPKVDAIFWGLLAISSVMTFGLFVVITFFLIRYRATSDVPTARSRA